MRLVGGSGDGYLTLEEALDGHKRSVAIVETWENNHNETPR